MQDITEKILAHIREKVKETLEEMIKEERRAYLEENLETKANGYYYLRSLNTPIGKLEGFRVARTRDENFNSELLPYFMLGYQRGR